MSNTINNFYMWLFALKRDTDGSLITPDDYIEYANKFKTDYKNDKKVFSSAEDGNKIFSIGSCINSKLFLNNLRSHYDDYYETKETYNILRKKHRDYKKNDANIEFLYQKMSDTILECKQENDRIKQEVRFHNDGDIMNSPEVNRLKQLVSDNRIEINTIPSLNKHILDLKKELSDRRDVECRLLVEYDTKMIKLKKKLDKEAMDTANKLYGNDLKDLNKTIKDNEKISKDKYKKLQAKYKQAKLDLVQAQSETSDDE